MNFSNNHLTGRKALAKLERHEYIWYQEIMAYVDQVTVDQFVWEANGIIDNWREDSWPHSTNTIMG